MNCYMCAYILFSTKYWLHDWFFTCGLVYGLPHNDPIDFTISTITPIHSICKNRYQNVYTVLLMYLL